MDNGTEFSNKSVTTFLQDLDIVHQSSCVYTPQQNGLVERKHMHLLNCSRALRFHASLPIKFGGDCVLSATYLINRTPSVGLNGKNSFEILFNTLPDYDSLRMFGSLCYVSVVPQSGDKFAARSIKSVFLGYPYVQKGYKVLDLESKKVFISRDVRFVKNVFPFKNVSSQPPQMLFPPLPIYVDDDPLQHTDSKVLLSDNQREKVIPPYHVQIANDRPKRNRHSLTKLLNYVGLPSHLVNEVDTNTSGTLFQTQ